uniref:Uncharacterized protein n=1 Tax=Clytia hemisphaerica TaxID=252671 RepID=A0A7M5UTB7_9CNID
MKSIFVFCLVVACLLTHAFANWWNQINTLSGCQCYFDTSRTDCACCVAGACQCGPSYPNRCIVCGSGFANCQGPEAWWEWTLSSTGCQCYWESSGTNCACCEPGGCQCGTTHSGRCIKCGASDIAIGCAATKPAEPTPSPTKPISTCGNRILLPLCLSNKCGNGSKWGENMRE